MRPVSIDAQAVITLLQEELGRMAVLLAIKTVEAQTLQDALDEAAKKLRPADE